MQMNFDGGSKNAAVLFIHTKVEVGISPSRLGDRTSQLPMHGSRKELGPKLVAKIKKDLGLL